MSRSLVSPDRFLAFVRREMARQSVGALIVPTSDPHNSEYVAARFQYRAKLSNFYGSAGTAVVTQDAALLWTDGRYWLEAEGALPAGWALQRAGMPGVPALEDWLAEAQAKGDYAAKGLFVGVDPYTYSAKAWEALAKTVPLKASDAAKAAYASAAAEEDGCEGTTVAAPSPVIVRNERLCGATPTEKVAAVLAKAAALPATAAPVAALLLTALDDIAWLTNMRGVSDVPYNPVFIAYAIIDAEERAVHLFSDVEKLCGGSSNAAEGGRTSVHAHCAAHNIKLHPYAAVEAFITERYVSKGKAVGIEEAQTNQALVSLIGSTLARRVPSIVTALKGVKNAVELKGMEDCHVRDGAALTRFLAWLTDAMVRGKGVIDGNPITESDASDRLAAFRAEEDYFRGPSFATISSSGPNGAVIHYHPKRGTDRALHADELYLVDSGGQYEDGTTDVTRVLTFAGPTPARPEELAAQRTAYTLVLKGHVALATAVFPQGVAGYRLDSLARQFLWAHGLDYAHGTGHGVGSFLCVHEGPHGIPFRLPPAAVPLEAGMIVSNEPGYYEDGAFGIRIENLVSVVGADASAMRYPSGKTAAGRGAATASLAFKQLTLVPYSKDLIDVSMLTPAEIAFVDSYHVSVRAALLPLLEARGDALAVAYLLEHTAPLA